MTESTKFVHPDGASTGSQGAPDQTYQRPLQGGLELAQDGAPAKASPSVRELLAELAALEDATRGLGGARRPRWTAQSSDLLAALAREQEIIEELRRRCPDGQAAARSSEDTGAPEPPD